MKRLLLGTVLSTALLLAACGSEETEKESMKAEETETETKTEETNTEETSADNATEEEETEVKYADGVKPLEDGVYEIEMAKVEIKDTEILPPNEYSDTGKDQLIIHFDVTSKVEPSEVDTEVSTMNIWMATMEATQETDTSIVDLGVGMAPMDERFDEVKNAQMDVIKKDATVPGIAFYELENRENPVVLEFKQDLMGDSLGSIEIDVTE